MSVAKLCEEVGKNPDSADRSQEDLQVGECKRSSFNIHRAGIQPENEQDKLNNKKNQQDKEGGFDSAQPDNGKVKSGIVNRETIEVTVYTTLANGKKELPYHNGEVRNVSGVNVHYFKRITKDHSHFSPSFLIHFWRTIKQFDIIHIHAWWNLVSVGAALICVLKGRPYVLSPRGTLSTYSFYNRKSIVKRFFHFLVGKPLLKKAIFQVSSTKEKKDIEQILSTNANIYIIPNFVELKKAWESDFEVNLNHPKAEILFFSRIEEKKGLEFLLEACTLLTVPYHLTIAGSGEESYVLSLKALGEKLKIAQHITWLGLVASENKFEILAQYDLLALPSYDENFANVVIESLACGTPVLLSHNVGLADYVNEKKLGWITEQDPVLIAKQLTSIFSKPREELTDLRIKALNTIKRDFTEEILTRTYLKFYHSIHKD